MDASPLTLDQLHAATGDLALGQPLILLTETDSTNDLARRYADKSSGQGALFVTEYQHAGRGRRGASWVSPPGKNLLFSLVLRPSWAVDYWARLTHIAAVALCDTLSVFIDPARVTIKWPNDLCVDGKKIAGLLVETGFPAAQAPYAILGVGLNVNMEADDWPAELAPVSHSLLLSTGTQHDRSQVLRLFLQKFHRLYEEAGDNFSPILSLARQRSGILGQRVEVTTTSGAWVARAIDLGPNGELIVEKNDRSTEMIHSVERLRLI